MFCQFFFTVIFIGLQSYMLRLLPSFNVYHLYTTLIQRWLRNRISPFQQVEQTTTTDFTERTFLVLLDPHLQKVAKRVKDKISEYV